MFVEMPQGQWIQFSLQSDDREILESSQSENLNIYGKQHYFYVASTHSMSSSYFFYTATLIAVEDQSIHGFDSSDRTLSGKKLKLCEVRVVKEEKVRQTFSEETLKKVQLQAEELLRGKTETKSSAIPREEELKSIQLEEELRSICQYGSVDPYDLNEEEQGTPSLCPKSLSCSIL